MKTASEIKNFCKNVLGMNNVRLKTGLGKGKWQTAWVRNGLNSQEPEFPVEFRLFCLKVVYGEGWNSGDTGGNIQRFSVALHAFEWERVLTEYQKGA